MKVFGWYVIVSSINTCFLLLVFYKRLNTSTNDHAKFTTYIEFNNELRNPLDLDTLSSIRDRQI